MCSGVPHIHLSGDSILRSETQVRKEDQVHGVWCTVLLPSDKVPSHTGPGGLSEGPALFVWLALDRREKNQQFDGCKSHLHVEVISKAIS